MKYFSQHFADVFFSMFKIFKETISKKYIKFDLPIVWSLVCLMNVNPEKFFTRNYKYALFLTLVGEICDKKKYWPLKKEL